ncbi:hypothetical protein G647_01256 [Cladophialophora carrionii CBS 160.54]|uniref:Uncharacterized protein n=1 Tax=Cladophialophora carrionii CBS 160.54 TaxID=1279043 RepID=V9DPH8_9EURO|nr:uncharacterized protein G647_01256 [Cladophialophora carrionii CBS 160.54]ETI28804.1 hypothetical protein G647_01256 [Cladophialophora carrionii CBS 160.54]
MATLCWALVAVLEIFNVLVRNNQGLSLQQTNLVNLARYMPTLGIIALAFGFKGVISDLKVVSPWSSMSGRWATAQDSVLLDYVNGIEFQSIFLAFRKGHWALAMALVVGLLFGVLVPVANSLTFVDDSASMIVSAPFLQKSTFDFDATLALPNGSLAVPLDYTGQKPYAAVASERLANGAPSPWTTGNLAFEAFSSTAYTPSSGTTIAANVTALSADLNCFPLRHNARVLDKYTITVLDGNEDDLKAASCSLPVQQTYYQDESLAYLNVTSCSDSRKDIRILATLISKDEAKFGNFTATGLICSPAFARQEVHLRVNGTTERAVSYTTQGDAVPTDIQTSVEALWIYLNNPLDTTTMTAFGEAQNPGPYNPTERPLATFSNITAAVTKLIQLGNADPFSSLLINGQADVFDFYVRNPRSFQTEVEGLASSIWAQTVNAFSRKAASLPMQGTIETAEARLFLRKASLRVMQALLGCIGLISVFSLTFLRPKTSLRTDPGPLASMALVLSASDPRVEERLGSHAQSTATTFDQALLFSKWSLQSTPTPGQMEVRLEDLEDPDADNRRSSTGAESWRPLPLRLSARIALVIAMLVFMTTLGILQWMSSKNRGLCRYTFLSSTVASIAPATILVLLGYWVSGDTVFFWSPTRPKTDQVLFTLVTSAVILLAVPVVKLIAAGLYDARPSLSEEIVAFQADTTLPDTVASIWNVSDFSAVVKRASEFTEWTTIPGFNVPQQPGIINNIVLSNITSVVLSPTSSDQTESKLNVRVPAIAVDVKCTPLPSSAFNLSATYSSLSGSWTFTWYCKSAPCSTLLNQTVQVQQSTVSKAHGLSPPYPYQGSSFVQNPDFDTNQSMGNAYLPLIVNTAFNVILADVSALIRPYDSIQNASLMEMPGNSTSNTMWVGDDTFSFPLPTVRALSCTRELSLVQVNATYARTSKIVVGDAETILPWSPVSVDLSSVTHERAYPTMQPYWFAPVTQPVSQYTQSDDMDGKLNSDSLWPKIGSPTNFWELLAAYVKFKADNLTSILDADTLAAATEAVLTAYCTQILTQLRPLALALAPDSQITPSLQGTLSQPEPRLVQNLTATIALESLLALMLCCIVWIFIQFPSESILPKPPDSIAARLSLLANSSIVRRLREARVADLQAMGIWREKAALGWWLYPGKSRTPGAVDALHDESMQWRWGIDVGPDVILRSWNSPPTAIETAELLKSVGSESSVPYISSSIGDSYPSLVRDGSRFNVRAADSELESLMERDQRFLLDEHSSIRPTMPSPGLRRASAG